MSRLLPAAVMSAVLLGGLWQCAPDKGEAPPNVLLISIDTLRADRLSSYGYGKNTTPVIDGFFGDDLTFSRCVSSAPWTLPSHASLFTSQYPSEHAAFGKVWSETRSSNPEEIENDITSLPPEAVTLAEVFRDSGYETAAYTGGGYIGKWTGLDQGFEIYDNAGGGIEKVMGKVLRWLKKRHRKPFFLFFHTFQTHLKYNAPRRFLDALHPELVAEVGEKRLEQLRNFGDSYGVLNGKHRLSALDRKMLSALYDAEIRYCDDTLAALFSFLEEQGLLEKTIVVFTSDHGEEFWDHGGFEHGHTVYNELLHVPLMIRNPADRGKRIVGELTRQIDLPVSILLMAGLEPPPSFRGHDLLAGPGEAGPVIALAEQTLYKTEKKTVLAEGFKLIEDLVEGTTELYDLESDFGERNDLAALNEEGAQARIERLKSLAGEFFPSAARSKGAGTEFDEQTKEQLRSLGYVH